jgi:hypothetical protein
VAPEGRKAAPAGDATLGTGGTTWRTGGEAAESVRGAVRNADWPVGGFGWASHREKRNAKRRRTHAGGTGDTGKAGHGAFSALKRLGIVHKTIHHQLVQLVTYVH